MNRVQRLLRQPPEVFPRALMMFHQDIRYELEAGESLSSLAGANLDRPETALLLQYIETLLAEPRIDDTDLRALFNRNCRDWGITNGAARTFFTQVAADLKKRLTANV